jgi:hypothetical protein
MRPAFRLSDTAYVGSQLVIVRLTRWLMQLMVYIRCLFLADEIFAAMQYSVVIGALPTSSKPPR